MTDADRVRAWRDKKRGRPARAYHRAREPKGARQFGGPAANLKPRRRGEFAKLSGMIRCMNLVNEKNEGRTLMRAKRGEACQAAFLEEALEYRGDEMSFHFGHIQNDSKRVSSIKAVWKND